MSISFTRFAVGRMLCASTVFVLALLSVTAVQAEALKKATITEDDVNAAQRAWCDGLVKIGKIHEAGGDYHTLASGLIDDLYDYEEGQVFFRPTLAYGKNSFRNTKEGALSYFVGGSQNFPEDSGFALKNWVKVDYDNNADENGIQIHGDIAITMGNVYLTNGQGDKIKVDKTFIFRKCSDGKLRLCTHKSVLPNEDAGK